MATTVATFTSIFYPQPKKSSTVRRGLGSFVTNAGLSLKTVLFSPPPPMWNISFGKVVREKLCELEIPHKFIASARGSPKVPTCSVLRGVVFIIVDCGQTASHHGRSRVGNSLVS